MIETKKIETVGLEANPLGFGEQSQVQVADLLPIPQASLQPVFVPTKTDTKPQQANPAPKAKTGGLEHIDLSGGMQFARRQDTKP